MANKEIHDYNAAVSIDAAADYLLIDPSSTGAYNKINRNVLLGLASAPLGTTDSQSPTNKTFDNTNSLTIKDGSFTMQNSSSVTKQAHFVLSGITAGQNRAITLPDFNATMASLAGTETLTNKTITSPTITGGTIDNSTVTVDSIAGHSSATIVTVANLQISNGVLNTAGAVTSTAVAAGAIQPQALFTGTGTGWSWNSYVPTFANTTKGNGTVAGAYIQIGKTVFFRAQFNMGSTSAVSSAPTVTLPITSVSLTINQPIGYSVSNDVNNTVNYPGTLLWLTTTTAQPVYGTAGGTYVQAGSITSTTPFSWAINDIIFVAGTYEAA